MSGATIKIDTGPGRKSHAKRPEIGLLAILCLAALPFAARAVEGRFAAEALRAYQSAQAAYQAHAEDPTNAWQFARTCFDLADLATNNTERAAIANQGITAARQALATNPNSAPAHYYLGLNQGQLARTETLGALRLVKHMEREFSTAAQLDPHLDYAGPDRSLGLLYRDAPSFGSIGSRTKARQHLQQAVRLAPDYPDNRLSLVESEIKWNDRNAARRQFLELEAKWDDARKTLSGPAWAASWADWNARFEAARKELGEPPKPLETPRH
jgi:tetratricopeptide (TPR) repeat protein